MIMIDLSKQQALDADPKAVQQINFTGNLAWQGRSERNRFRFFIRNCESIVNFYFI